MMTNVPGTDAPSSSAPGERLESWKEIAAYLRRDVTTAQRWEKREGLPVHRHLHDKAGSVYAFRSELDAWALRRRSSGAPEATDVDAAIDTPAGDAGASDHARLTGPQAQQSLPRSGSFRWMLALAAVFAIVVAGAAWQMWGRQRVRNVPVADAAMVPLTDFGGVSQAAAISRDGQYAAFLSDRDGRMDLWVTHIGTGVFYNRTREAAGELVNPAIRTVGFTPDNANVTFWARGAGGGSDDISVWAVPVLGGQPRPYIEGAAESDASRDGSRVVYHTAGPGDPTFVRDAARAATDRLVFSAPLPQHSHFPTWSPDQAFIYFVQGQAPDHSAAGIAGVGLRHADIWRIKADGGPLDSAQDEPAERLTYHDASVSHPVFIDDRTLLYLATDQNGAGPFIHSLDVERRTTRQLQPGSGIERYASLSASADGTRVVATLARSSGTLWRLPIGKGSQKAEHISVPTANGASPRFGAGYFVYVSSKSGGDSIWKMRADGATELWSAADARIVGGPAISRDGRHMAFAVRQRDRRTLFVANTDGTGARAVPASLVPDGDPAWAPDGRSLTIAALERGGSRVFSVDVETGRAVRLVDEHSTDPVWSPDGRFLIYSGADVGTTFPLHAAAPDGTPQRLPPMGQFTRGARRMVFLPGQRTLLVLRGEIRHKNLWTIDLDTGAERQLTEFPQDFDVSDFDVSPDGTELVVEQAQERSEIVLFDPSRLR
jgi:Tol biopolymer transport system component